MTSGKIFKSFLNSRTLLKIGHTEEFSKILLSFPIWLEPDRSGHFFYSFIDVYISVSKEKQLLRGVFCISLLVVVYGILDGINFLTWRRAHNWQFKRLIWSDCKECSRIKAWGLWKSLRIWPDEADVEGHKIIFSLLFGQLLEVQLTRSKSTYLTLRKIPFSPLK